MRDSEKLKNELLGDDKPQLEKGDRLAMLIAGFLTVGLPCILMILLITAVTWLLFIR